MAAVEPFSDMEIGHGVLYNIFIRSDLIRSDQIPAVRFQCDDHDVVGRKIDK